MNTSINLALQNNTPFNQQVSLFNNGSLSVQNAASNDFNLYSWDVTSFSFLYEFAVTIQNKLIGASLFTTSTAFLSSQTLQGVCDALNTLNIGQFYIATIGTDTFIQVYSKSNVYASLDITNALSLTFDSILNTPVADPSDVAQWNTFFVTYSSPFTYVSISGNIVNLFGVVFLEIDNSKFLNSTSLLNVISYGAITLIDISGFENSSIISFIDVAASLALIQANSFKNCVSLNTFNTVSFTSFNNNCFQNCTSLTTIYLPYISNLSGTNIFLGIIANNITLTIPTALVSNTNVVYLQANNTVTLVTT